MGATNPDRFFGENIVTGGWVNNPADASKVFQGAGFIRSTRKDLRAAISTEHVLNDEDFEIGEHAEGSAKCYVLDDAQASVQGGPDKARGRMRFNKEERSLAVSDGEGFIPLGSFFPGQITMSAVAPNEIIDGWALCDGRNVTVNEADGLYARLIRRLTGNSNATQARLPDLRDQFIRGWSASRQVVNSQTVGTGASASDVYNYQEHAFEDHKHEMSHTHGATLAGGRDGNNVGRTGVVTEWNNGAPEIDDDGRHRHNFVAIRNTRRTSDFIGTTVKGADDPSEGTTVENDLSDHNHQIPRYYGTSGFAGITADSSKGITQIDYNTADETRPDNVAMFYVIKL